MKGTGKECKSLFTISTPPRRSSFCRQGVIPIVPCSHSI
ncbi:hypothetical protein BN2364_3724 [Alloalcanivorax xenomutans]|nr:hypothetical protein BN2364_3724 [Alloalcanivorax xenomutans]